MVVWWMDDGWMGTNASVEGRTTHRMGDYYGKQTGEEERNRSSRERVYDTVLQYS